MTARLAEFAAGSLSLPALEEALDGWVVMRFWDTNERQLDFQRELPPVVFSATDVRRKIEEYVGGAITARELSDWAAAMRLLDCFDLDERTSHPDDTWDVIDELASPDAWGELTLERALFLMKELGRDASNPS